MANCEEYNYGKQTPVRTCCGMEIVRADFTGGSEWQDHFHQWQLIHYPTKEVGDE